MYIEDIPLVELMYGILRSLCIVYIEDISRGVNVSCILRIYIEDVPLVEFIPCILKMYLWRSLCMLYLLACQMRFTVAESGLCCGNYV